MNESVDIVLTLLELFINAHGNLEGVNEKLYYEQIILRAPSSSYA